MVAYGLELAHQLPLVERSGLLDLFAGVVGCVAILGLATTLVIKRSGR